MLPQDNVNGDAGRAAIRSAAPALVCRTSITSNDNVHESSVRS
jgi:hypothetical protein